MQPLYFFATPFLINVPFFLQLIIALNRPNFISPSGTSLLSLSWLAPNNNLTILVGPRWKDLHMQNPSCNSSIAGTGVRSSLNSNVIVYMCIQSLQVRSTLHTEMSPLHTLPHFSIRACIVLSIFVSLLNMCECMVKCMGVYVCMCACVWVAHVLLYAILSLSSQTHRHRYRHANKPIGMTQPANVQHP